MRGCDWASFFFFFFKLARFIFLSVAVCEGGVAAPLQIIQTMPPEQRGGHAMAIREISTNFTKK